MRVFLSIFFASIVSFGQIPEPKISFEKTHHDFGRVHESQQVSYKYKVTNNGNAPLQIKELRSSCGCSVAIVGQSKLKPDESNFVEVSFNASGIMGSIHKSVEVISDDPKEPSTQLTFEASVIRDIMPSSTVVFFDKVSRNTSTSASIRLQSGNDQPVIVTETTITNAPYLSCNQHREGNDVILNVNIDGKLIPKQLDHDVNLLTVNTTNDKYPAIQFQIRWSAPQTTIISSHNRIIWSGVTGREMRTSVSLTHSGGEPFRILETESTSPLIEVVGITKNSVAEHHFDVILSAKAKAGGYKEVLIFKLDDPEQDQLKIDIVAMLQ